MPNSIPPSLRVRKLHSNWYNRAVYTTLACLLFQLFTFAGHAQAVAGILSNTQLSFQRMAATQTTVGTVCAKAGTSASTTSIKDVQVTYPASFTVSTTTSNWTTNTTSNNFWPASSVAWPFDTTVTVSIATNVNASDTVIFRNTTVVASGFTAGTTYCFNWTTAAALTQPSGAASNERGILQTCSGAGCSSYTAGVGNNKIDLGRYATATTSSTGDQFTVTATVLAQFNFALSSTTDPIGNVDNTAVSNSTGINATIGTNAANGWGIWAKDSNTGLTSANASKTIASTTPGTNATLVAGTEGYVMGVCITTRGDTAPATVSSTGLIAGGLVAATQPYAGGTLTNNNCTAQTTGKGSGLDTTFRGMAASTGTSSGTVVQLQSKAAVNTATPAATDYADTVTCVAAGFF